MGKYKNKNGVKFFMGKFMPALNCSIWHFYKKTEPENTSINTLANEINENRTFKEQDAIFNELDKSFAFLRQKVGQSN